LKKSRTRSTFKCVWQSGLFHFSGKRDKKELKTKKCLSSDEIGTSFFCLAFLAFLERKKMKPALIFGSFYQEKEHESIEMWPTKIHQIVVELANVILLKFSNKRNHFTFHPVSLFIKRENSNHALFLRSFAHQNF